MAEGSTPIDSLSIEISATAKSAEESLNDLKASLESLKSILGNGGGLSAVAKELDTVGKKTEGLGDTAAKGVEKLVQALKDLQGASKLNLTTTANDIENVSKKSEKAAVSLNKSTLRLGAALIAVRKLSSTIASFIDKSNAYVENLNLFNASLGDYATEAKEYAEMVGDIMGIDPSAWMRNQGVFQTLATGFGVSADRAYIMSKNLTQLGYDLSSFFNIAVDGEGGAMQKLQAAFSGELEPLRRLGYDLSEARLKTVALNLGIEQSFNTMNQAQKAQLRYYAILTQVTTAQGDMARTLNAPANQLRIFKAQTEQAARALGNIFIPSLNAVLPYAIALTQALREVAQAIADLVGFALPEVDYSGITGAETAAEGLDSALQSAGGSAKKLNDLLADWDELNIIQSKSGGSGSGGASAYNASDWAFDLPEYDFLKEITKSRVSQILEGWKPTIQWITDHIDELSSTIAAIGASLLTWKLATGLMPDLKEAAGYLNVLMGVVGTIAVVTGSIVLDISFTTNWLETGNWGSLLGSAITTVASSSILAALIRHVVTGEKGEKLAPIAAGTLMTVEGIIDLSLSLQDVQKKGFTRENIYAMFMSGLETTAGMTLIGRQIAAALTGQKSISKGQTAGVAAAALMASANVILNLALTEGGLTKGDPVMILESLGTNALTAAGVGTAVGVTFKSASAGFIATGIMLTADAVMDIALAVGDVVENGITEENILTALKGTLEAAVAGGLITSYGLTGSFDLQTAGFGALSFLTAAVGIGLSAWLVKDSAKQEEADTANLEAAGSIVTSALTAALAGFTVTQATGNVKYGYLISGVTMGIDATINSFSLYNDISENGFGDADQWITAIGDAAKYAAAGVGIGMTIGHPLAGGLIGAGIGLAIEAGVIITGLINNTKKSDLNSIRVKRGGQALTERQIEKIAGSFFKFDVDGHIETITAKADSRTALETDVTSVVSEIEKQLGGFVLGIDDATSLTSITESLLGNSENGTTGLIGNMKELIRQNGISIKDFLVGDGNFTVDENTLLQMLGFVESDTEQMLTDAGAAWGDWVGHGFADEFKAQAQEAMSYISDLTNAYNSADSEAAFNIALAGLSLEDVNGESVMNVLDGYKKIRDNLWDAYKQDEENTYTDLLRELKIAKVNLAHTAETDPKYAERKAAVDGLLVKVKEWEDDIASGYGKANDLFRAKVSSSDAELLAQMMWLFGTDLYRNDYYSDIMEGDYPFTSWDEVLELVGLDAADKDWDTFVKDAKNLGFEEMIPLLEPFKDAISDPAFAESTKQLMIEYLSQFDWAKALLENTEPTESNAAVGEINYVQSAYEEAKTAIENDPITLAVDSTDALATMKALNHWTSDPGNDVLAVGGGLGSPSNINPTTLRGPENPYYAGTFAAIRVDTITQSTAIPGNEQTQANIAAGVSEGSKDQNELLRQQNVLLKQILAKTGTITPSTALGRTIKRSNELLSVAEGVTAAVGGFTIP